MVERFGPMSAGEIRRKRGDDMRAYTHWKSHLDEVYAKINGEMHYLWRAVDHEGEVLESFVTKTREFASVHGSVHDHFRQERHLVSQEI